MPVPASAYRKRCGWTGSTPYRPTRLTVLTYSYAAHCVYANSTAIRCAATLSLCYAMRHTRYAAT
eukprot:2601889-Rhodomonas_salina.1